MKHHSRAFKLLLWKYYYGSGWSSCELGRQLSEQRRSVEASVFSAGRCTAARSVNGSRERFPPWINRGGHSAGMATFRAFHSQLLSIMESLTKAAVTEICELVDDSYAVLQLEISRSHKENEALRMKLELIESIIARKNRDAAISGGSRAEEDAEGRQSGGSRPEFNLGEKQMLFFS